MDDEIRKVVESTIDDFCLLFYKHPYLEYNESGVHALFFHILSENFIKKGIPLYDDYIRGDTNERVCLIQKEYRMFGKCNKTKAASWDICVLNNPLKSVIDLGEVNECNQSPYDCLEINSIVEFGLKANVGHMKDDVERLAHNECNAIGKFIVHLERFSDYFSGRDYPLKSNDIFPTEDDMKYLTNNNKIIIYYVRTNKNNEADQKVWKFSDGRITNLLQSLNK